jgi:hypothetical protein
MLNHRAGSGQHSYEARQVDLYETPPCAVEALLKVEKLPKKIWEPACGPGAIVKVLRSRGHEVIGSDLLRYEDPTYFYGRDFLTEKLPQGCEMILSNPPFQLAEAFVRHAIKICPRVIFLLRLAFLESERRTDILENAGLARIYVFRNRLPMAHRAGWTGPKASSAMAFAWFFWCWEYEGFPTVHRISWEKQMCDPGRD